MDEYRNVGHEIHVPNRLTAVNTQLVQQKINGSFDLIPLRTRQELMGYQWYKDGYQRDNQSPELEIFTTSTHALETTKFGLHIGGRIALIMGLMGYSREDVRKLEVFLDPSNDEFGYGGSTGAIFSADEETHQNSILLKAHNMFGLDHELFHYVTVGKIEEYPETTSIMLIEGIAVWGAWQIKDERDKTTDIGENYREIITTVPGNRFVPRNKISLDYDFSGNENSARIFGGLLFDVIYDKLGSDARRVAEAWKTAGKFERVSDWIESLGLASQEVEADWIKRLNYIDETGLKTNPKRIFF